MYDGDVMAFAVQMNTIMKDTNRERNKRYVMSKLWQRI